jgi:hypothetical protein
MNDRNQTDYNSIVGYDVDGNAVILNYTFTYSDDFHGATGSVVELVSQEQYAFDTDPENMAEWAEDLWREDAGNTNGTTNGLDEWIADKWDELLESRYDSSDSEYVPAGNHATTNCIACGRIFPHAIDRLVKIVNLDLIDVIRAAEAGNPD